MERKSHLLVYKIFGLLLCSCTALGDNAVMFHPDASMFDRLVAERQGFPAQMPQMRNVQNPRLENTAMSPQYSSQVVAPNAPISPQYDPVVMPRVPEVSSSTVQKPQAKIGDGFYVVAMAGRMLGVNNGFHNVTIVPPPEVYYSNVKSALNGLTGYMGAGYGVQFKGAYVGIEGFMGKIRNQNNYIYNNQGYTNSQEVVLGVKWAVASRLGYYVSPVSLLYGKLGVSQNSAHINGAGTTNSFFPNQAQSFNTRGYQWGGGLEVALNNHLSARIETYQTLYKKSNLTYVQGGNALTDLYKFRAQEMLVGIAVKPSALGGPMDNSQYEEVPSGIYGGVEAGVSGTEFKQEFVEQTTQVNYKTPAASIKAAGGIYGGYAHTIGRFYVAGEVQLESSKSKVIQEINQGNNTSHAFSNDSLGPSMALSTRLGYVFDNGTVGYGRIGFIRSRFRHNAMEIATIALGSGWEKLVSLQPYSKVLHGLRVGGGLEIALNRSLRLRGDYTLDIYPGVSWPGISDGSREKMKIARNEVKLGLAYTLPPFH